MTLMQILRQHVASVLAAVVAGVILGSVAASNNWGDSSLYAAGFALIALIVAAALAADQRTRHSGRRN